MIKKIWNRFTTNESGSTIVLVGLALAGLLAMSALVIDGGSIYVMKSRLQSTANAAALSGAQELTNTQLAVSDVVNQALQDNNELSSLTGTNITMGSKLTVHLQKSVSVAFLKIFGYSSIPVQADATAILQVMGQAKGIAPLGIDGSVPLVYNQTYQLKVDETGQTIGNFGVLALGSAGAQTYEDNLIYGYQNEIKVGDILPTQTGNVVGKTRDGVNILVSESPYPSGETWHRDDPRVILVPVYKPYTYATNQLQSVIITGFAYFYILQPMASMDKTITGMFIKRTGTGLYNQNALDKGAYAIRLIK